MLVSDIFKMPKFVVVRNMNYAGEIMTGEFDGEFYVLQDGDCYLPETLKNYDIEFMDEIK